MSKPTRRHIRTLTYYRKRTNIMDTTTQKALNKALEMMDVPTAVKIIIEHMPAINNVAMLLDLQTVTTPAAQVHVILHHIQAVQS